MLESMQLDQFIQKRETLEFGVEELPKIVQLLQDSTSSDARIYLGCFALQKLLSLVRMPPFREAVEANVIPCLLKFAQRFDFPAMQLEAVWSLTNLASDSTGIVQVLVD